MIKDKLPDTPHGLLRLALADLKTAEASPKFQINMDAWVGQRDENSPCIVCLAGAVMAQTLNITHKTITFPIRRGFDISPWQAFSQNKLSKKDKQKLHGLNSARSGQWDMFFEDFNFFPEDKETPQELLEILMTEHDNPPPYDHNSKKFFEYMHAAADAIETWWHENVAKEHSDDNKG